MREGEGGAIGVERRQLALLGAGVMGHAVSAKLRQTYDLRIWSRRTDRARQVAQGRDHVAVTPAEAVADADFVLSFVADDAASEAVWFGPDGASDSLPVHALCLEGSTLSVEHVGRWHQRLHALGNDAVATPVTGSVPRAQSGDLVAFVGGEDRARKRAVAALAPIVGTFFEFPSAEDSAAYKLIHNMVGGSVLAAVAEGLALASRTGLDADLVLTILSRFGWAAGAAQSRGRAMLDGDGQPYLCATSLMAKDLGYALAMATTHSLRLPVAMGGHEDFARASALGFGDRDMSAVIEALA